MISDGIKQILKILNCAISTQEKRNAEGANKPFNAIEYEYPARRVKRLLRNDRVFPLDTVRIESFNRKHGENIEEAVIHIGSYADELARSMNALAVTIANDIYFRNNTYNPASEEGREILAHELTHVAQYKEGKTSKREKDIKKELESEAVQAEVEERYEADPYVPFLTGQTVRRIRKSQMKTVARMVADKVEAWLAQQKDLLPEEKYLKFLCAYEGWLREGI